MQQFLFWDFGGIFDGSGGKNATRAPIEPSRFSLLFHPNKKFYGFIAVIKKKTRFGAKIRAKTGASGGSVEG